MPTAEGLPSVFCQVCGAENLSDREFCARCHQKLMVISGAIGGEAEQFESERGV